MQDATARNLRTAERYLLAPPLAAAFGSSAVAVCDISEQGARFRHDRPIETGSKAVLELKIDGRRPVPLQAVIVWSHADSMQPGHFVSGARTYAPADVVTAILGYLRDLKRSNRIEELRGNDRFAVAPALDATFAGLAVSVENLSARGARIAAHALLANGSTSPLKFVILASGMEVAVSGTVVWSGVKAVGDSTANYRAGVALTERPELVRLAIATLCDQGRASLDMHSLRLKLKVIRARARQLAPTVKNIESSGIPAEQYLLIQGVREELRLNPEEAMHWYRRARISINDPATRAAAPHIANHPDALAVWEYLDRSVDPTIVGRAFDLR
jgi:hypothetical protein